MFTPKILVTMKTYTWKGFRADMGAGVVVGLVALPLAMAFAIASGLPPGRGLVTAVVAGFLAAALGGSRVSISGPTGAFVVILAGIVQKYGYEGLAVATGMAGVILIIMGLTQMGTLVKYIPYPVTTGFTSGIAVIIFTTQMRDLFGLQMESIPSDFLEKWAAYAGAFHTFNPSAVGLFLLTFLCLVFWPRGWKIPGSIVGLALAAWLAWYFGLPVETVGSRFGTIVRGLPMPHFVVGSWIHMKELLPSALTIAMLAAIESLLCAVVADGMIGSRHKSNMELVAQGVANCVSPFFGGIPATGAIARTATNIRNGGRTPVAGIVHSLVLFLILVAAAPLAERVPLAALAAVLVLVAYHMSEWRSVKFILSGSKSDIAVLVTTFLLTVLVDLTVAVGVGMVLASFLFMRKMAELTQVKALRHERDEALFNGDIPKDVEVFSINGSFFFGAAGKLMEIDQSLFQKPKALILEMRGVLHMDTSGLMVLEQVVQRSKSRGVPVLIVGLHAQPLFAAEKAGFYQRLGENSFFGTMADALKSIQTSEDVLG